MDEFEEAIIDAMIESWIKDDVPILVKQKVKEKLKKQLSILIQEEHMSTPHSNEMNNMEAVIK